jgi:hypothetical protein
VELVAILKRLGYRSEWHRSRAIGVQWPPNPFADRHLVQCTVAVDSPVDHFVVWLRDGRVLDPLNQHHPDSLAEYYRVNYVIGVTRL